MGRGLPTQKIELIVFLMCREVGWWHFSMISVCNHSYTSVKHRNADQPLAELYRGVPSMDTMGHYEMLCRPAQHYTEPLLHLKPQVLLMYNVCLQYCSHKKI